MRHLPARLRALLPLLCLVLVSSLCCSYPARAERVGQDTPRVNGPWFTDNNLNYYVRHYTGQCTWYVFGRCGLAGWPLDISGDDGNADAYYANIADFSRKDYTPEAGAVMCFSNSDVGGIGHVAYVDRVINNNTWVVDHYNWGEDSAYYVSTVTRDPGSPEWAYFEGERIHFTGFVHPPSQGAGAASHTHMLWSNADGRAAFWLVNADGSHGTTGIYGPYTDGGGTWRAVAVATGPNGVNRILWTNPDGRATLWYVNPDASYGVSDAYGPYADSGGVWKAAALSVGPDNVAHILWTNPDGRATLWFVNPNGAYGVVGAYGPYADPGGLWTAAALATGPNGVSRILWNNPDGRCTLWYVNPDASYGVSGAYGPYVDSGGVWGATALSVGPDSVAHILWGNPDGRATLWFVNPTGAYGMVGAYGPYADGGGTWGAAAIATSPDNVTHILWDNPDGRSTLWFVNPGGAYGVLGAYGPFADSGGAWRATADSAGP